MIHHYYNDKSAETRRYINIQAILDEAQKELHDKIRPQESVVHYHAQDATCEKSHHEYFLFANTIISDEKPATDPEFELKSKQHRWEHS